MKRSKIHIALAALAVIAIIGASHWVYAQGRPGGPRFGPGFRGMDRPRAELARELGLTDAQKTDIQAVLDSARTQLDTLRSDMALTREQRIDQAQQVRQQTREQIRSLLTADQQLKADELRERAEQRFRERQEMMQERMLTRLTERLGLSESQQSTIQLYLDDQRTQLDIAKDNPSLTASEKLGEARRIHQETQEKIRAALTADQQAQLDAMQERMQEHRRGGPRRGPRGGGFRGQGLPL
jgi:hypothetical protein